MDDRPRAGARQHRRRTGAGGRPWRVAAAAAALALAGLATVVAPHPAGAGGGDWMYPARDRYEPGQTVTLIGYGQVADPAWREKGPYYAYLRVDPVRAEADAARADATTDVAPYIHPTDLRVGQVVVEDAAEPVTGGYWRPQRASVTFSLPDDLAPLAYTVQLCNDPCTAGLDYLCPEPVNVGVDPAYPIVRDWPLTDPAIRWLEDDALLVGPHGPVTAADVRSGRVPMSPPQPSPLPEVTASPVTEPAAPATEPVTGATPPDPTPRTDPAADVETGQPATEGDGGALAWWIVGEAAVLVVGCSALLHWTGRRRARLEVVPPAADEAQSDESTQPVLLTGSVVPAADPAGKASRAAPAGGVRHAQRIRQ
jgi:hypothetical protein